MAVATRPPVLANGKAAVPNDYIWRLSVAQYHEMIEAGILTDDDPIELLEGWLVPKMPKNPPHVLATELTRAALASLLPTGWHVNAQGSMTTKDSEPEPDVQVIRGELRDYVRRHPGPRDLALVVEVADTSLTRDRSWKKRVYAAAKIPVYWIVNLPDSQVEVYSKPAGSRGSADYHNCNIYEETDKVPVVVSGKRVGSVPAREILP